MSYTVPEILKKAYLCNTHLSVLNNPLSNWGEKYLKRGAKKEVKNAPDSRQTPV